jgi:rhodanese-related sulfurtransferase
MAGKITPKELREEKDEYKILDVREDDELQEGKIGEQSIFHLDS